MGNETNSVKTALLTVLVVDDDKMVRQIIIEHLKQIGFQRFIEAADGSEAYKIIIDPRQKVDLILCDWEMPRTDGLTFLKAVRGSRGRANTPFIMITSQQSQERMKISKAKISKVDAYIVKPFRAETLREKVFQVLFDALEKNRIVS
jgi:two-component system, chemotaxis family, chemotaxis protein CheY